MSPDRAFLEDILFSARLAVQYLDGISSAEFEVDLKTQDAVIRRLEVIGEAVKWLENDVKEAMPSVQWRRISGMRNCGGIIVQDALCAVCARASGATRRITGSESR